MAASPRHEDAEMLCHWAFAAERDTAMDGDVADLWARWMTPRRLNLTSCSRTSSNACRCVHPLLGGG